MRSPLCKLFLNYFYYRKDWNLNSLSEKENRCFDLKRMIICTKVLLFVLFLLIISSYRWLWKRNQTEIEIYKGVNEIKKEHIHTNHFINFSNISLRRKNSVRFLNSINWYDQFLNLIKGFSTRIGANKEKLKKRRKDGNRSW